VTQSYVERAPRAELAGVVRTVWAQRSGEAAYVQRHLPTGGVEIHVPIGGRARLIGPLTGPMVEVLPPRTTIVGVRFHPGMAPRLPGPLGDLVDERVDLADLWGSAAVERIGEATARASTPEAALDALQAELVERCRHTDHIDPLVAEAVRCLMPWPATAGDGASGVGEVAAHLAISPSQLRRRCLASVGVGPKALQRTLRFQGYLALAQAGARRSGKVGSDGVAGLAIDVGYADHAHLGRECRRLTGLTPRQLLGGDDRCGCGHDHAASYLPFLGSMLDSYKRPGLVRS
jgi:AraC-like DNA-binding protein